MSDPERKRQRQEDRERVGEYLSHHEFMKTIANIGWRVSIVIFLLLTQDGRDVLKDPELFRSLFDREGQVGLLEGSIFNHQLYYPNPEETSLMKSLAVAGRYAGYDFVRPKEFGPMIKERGRQVRKDGKLLIVPLIEIEKNPPDMYTSTYLLNIYDLVHISRIQEATISEAISEGLVEETTYREAYTKMSLFQKYRLSLELRKIVDEPLYQVTPKGNSLVALEADFGKKKKSREREKVLRPVLGVSGY